MTSLRILLLFPLWASSMTISEQPKPAHTENSYMRREAQELVLSQNGEASSAPMKHRASQAAKTDVAVAAQSANSMPKTPTVRDVRARKANKRGLMRRQTTHLVHGRKSHRVMRASHTRSARRAKAARKVQHRKRASVLQKQDPTNTTAATEPTQLVPADTGKSISITSADAFVKDFIISFWVKFDNFTANDQILIKTDEDALQVQALGPKYGENSSKLEAWVRTESGLGGDGVNGRGILGCGHGELMSQALSANTWYQVQFVKSPSQLFLSVGGVTVPTAISYVDRTILIQNTDFDLMAGSTAVLAGKLAGSGDIGLRGQMGDVSVVEGTR